MLALRRSPRGASGSAQNDGVDFKTRTDRGDAGSSSATSARCQEASATEEREKANPSCVYYDSDEEHGVVFGDEEDELIVGDEERPANYPTIEEKYKPWRQRPAPSFCLACSQRSHHRRDGR